LLGTLARFSHLDGAPQEDQMTGQDDCNLQQYYFLAMAAVIVLGTTAPSAIKFKAAMQTDSQEDWTEAEAEFAKLESSVRIEIADQSMQLAKALHRLYQ